MSPPPDDAIANALRIAEQVQRDTPSLVRASVDRPREPSVASVTRRGSPIAPHAPDPSPAALAAARADDRMGANHVNQRLDTIVPPSERVVAGLYSAGAPGGGRWADRPDITSRQGLGFSLPPRNHNQPPETLPGLGAAQAAPEPSDDDHLRRLWGEAVSESSAAARNAVGTHNVRPTFTADDWHQALSLPMLDHLWYELSGEKLAENLPGLTHSEHMKMLDILGATSARAKPGENLERTLAAISQHVRGVPVDTDLTIPETVKQALARDHKKGTSALPGNKTGHFSDTLAIAGGVPARYPISVNDIWVGRMFGVPEDVMSSNQSLHEPMAKYFNKLRDFYNERFKDDLPFPYQSWNFQAGAWVHLRSKDAGRKDGDAYHQVWDKALDKARAAGVPGITADGKITRQALMHPGFADAMRPTLGPWRDAPKATVELGTKLTGIGARARALYEDAIQRGDELSQKEYLSGLTTAMYASARGSNKPWDHLKKAITGDVTQDANISRIAHPTTESPFDAGGTFEGDVSPNIRVPLRDMEHDDHLNQFNSVAGHHLIQAAMAASTVLAPTALGAGPRPDHTRSHSVFVPTQEQIPDNLLRVFARELKIRNHDTSFQRHPNGYQFDVIPDFSDWRNPRGIDLHDLDEAYGAALRPHYGVGKYSPNDFKSVYTMAEDYGTHRANLVQRIRNEYIAEIAKTAGVKQPAAERALRAKAYPANLPRGGKKAWDVYRARHDHLAQAEEGFKALAQRVNDAHASFITRAEMRATREARQRINDARTARVPRADGGRIARMVGGMADCGPAGNPRFGSPMVQPQLGGRGEAPPPAMLGPGGAASAWDNFNAATYRGPMPTGGTMSAAAPTLSPPAMQNPFNSTTYGPGYPGGAPPPTMPFQQQSSGKGAGGSNGLSQASINAPPSYMGGAGGTMGAGAPMQSSQGGAYGGIGNMLQGFLSRLGFADGGAVADDGTAWRNVSVAGEGASKDPVEVAVNPTHDEITSLVKGSDRGAARLSKDTDGNVYAWDANRALHDHVQKAMGFKADRKAMSPIGQMPIARLHQGKLRLTDVMGMSFPGGVNGWHRVKRADGGEVGAPPGIGHNQPPDEMVTPPSPSYIKPAPADDYQRKLSPLGLYSHAAEAVWKQPQMKASPDQFKATLINKHGVKPDEFKWTNYDEAFKGRPMVTKREVRDHFLKNQPKLDERRYSQDEYDYDSDTGASGVPKYDSYTLPGGKNYRELVTHMPKQVSPDAQRLQDARDEAVRRHRAAAQEKLRAEAGVAQFLGQGNRDEAALEAARQRLRDARAAHDEARSVVDRANVEAKRAKSEGNYQSSHWDEPNVVAHLRLSDRKTAPPVTEQHVVHNYVSGNKSQPFATREEAEAFIKAQPAALRDKLAPSVVRQPASKPLKILHLEELQSDWGQDARDHGIKQPPLNDAEQAELKDYIQRQQSLTPAERTRWEALGKREDNTGVSAAPYITSTEKWTELGLKRALHEAATGGYDRLVITPGQAQAGRYDLSAVASRLHYSPDTQRLHAYDSSGREVHGEMHTPEQLPGVVGREVAARLLAAPVEVSDIDGKRYQRLQGEDLSVGGEGMKAYYDRLLPRTLEKLAKQHDPKARVQLHAHPIEVKRDRRGNDLGPGDRQAMLEHHDMSADEFDDLPADEQARTYRDYLRDAPPAIKHLHALDITPAMRASILKGQRSFAQGGAVQVEKRLRERLSGSAADKIYRKIKAEIPVFGRYQVGGRA